MEQKVPLPAATARRIALATIESARDLHEEGFVKSSRANQQAAARVLAEATRDKGGQFISVDAMDLTAVTYTVGNHDGNVATQYLRQYKVW